MQQLTRHSAHGLRQVRMVGEGFNEIITIDEAFRRADELGLDLVLVGKEATPPVVRIQDFKKLEYEKKKAKKAKKVPQSTLKEIQFKINISDHDLATKVNKIEKFLKRGDKVKIVVRLKGREKENPGRAYELLDKVASSIECTVSKVPGPIAIAILEATKQPAAAKTPTKKVSATPVGTSARTEAPSEE